VEWVNGVIGAGKAGGDMYPDYFYPCYRFYIDIDNIFYVPAIDLSLLKAGGK
jgi:hypothetical protein